MFLSHSTVDVVWHRNYRRGHYVISLGVSIDHGHAGGGCLEAGCPEASAVVDDFGTLVCVTAWR